MRIPRRPQRPLNSPFHNRCRRPKPGRFFLGALLAALLALPACKTAPPVPSVSLPVPFVPQPPDHCGPAALLMVARHHGLDPDPDALDAATYLPALEGTTPEVLLHAAQTFLGCPSARLLPLDPSDPQPLFDAVDVGIPPILFLAPPEDETSDTRGHFLVVVGYQPTTTNLLVHTGSTPSRPLPPARYRSRLRTALLLPPPP